MHRFPRACWSNMLPRRMFLLLMLVFLLCDVNSTWPTDCGPLILDPPSIIREYGSKVNCRRDGSREAEMTNESFVSWTMSLSDWNVTKAVCMIQLNASFECTKDLDIIIYKNPGMVALYPIKHANTKVEGTQYELQCDIIDVAPVQNLTVRWYKGDRIISTRFFTNPTTSLVSESSVWAHSINRGDNGAQFRCEAQLDFGPHGPLLPSFSETHVVSVQYAPELNSTTTDVISVEGGNNVTLKCDADGNPLPTFYWARDGLHMSGKMNYLNVTQVNTNTTYTCTATNPLGTITKHFRVHVMEDVMKAPAEAEKVCPLTLTPAEIVVRFGDRATINCSTTDSNFSGFGWKAPTGRTEFVNLTTVTWTVEKLEHWGIKPQCHVSLKNDFQCTEDPSVTLYKTPDDVSVTTMSPGPMVEGREHLLVCKIVKVAPLQSLKVMWYRGNEHVRTEMFNKTSVRPINVSSTLRVIPESDNNGAVFRCDAELHLGPEGPRPVPTTSSEPYAAVVHYKPMMHGCPTRYAGVEHDFRLDMLPCQPKGNPPPTIRWYYQGNVINQSQPLTREQSGKYTAEVGNTLSKSNTSVDITVEYSPSFSCQDHYEVEENVHFQIKCEPDGIPAPTIIWFKGGNEIVPPRRWTKRDNGTYVLKASNKHGSAKHTVYLDVVYAPEFKEGNRSEEVGPGENKTLECRAEGNPVPELLWRYTSADNVRETTGGRHRRVSLTGATSTNAGVYVCVATNKVGSASMCVTLVIKDRGWTSGGQYLWWLLPLCFFSGLLILVIALCKRRKKHGQYSFIPGQTKDGSDIPMTTTQNSGGSA